MRPLVAGLSVLLLLGWALNVGPAGQLWGAHSLGWPELLELRGWRSLLALAEGAGLATSGLLMQTLFRNPLVDASLLGVSQGAALGMVLALSLGWGVGQQECSAALLALLLLSVLVLLLHRGWHWSLDTVLLAGLALNALLGAFLQLWLSLLSAERLQGVWGFLQGSLAQARPLAVGMTLFSTAGLWWWAYRQHRALDWLLLGEAAANSAGIPVQRLHRQLVVLCALTVAILVSQAGVIGFVGMLAPALVRWRMTGGHKYWLPQIAWLGGVLVLLADILARILVSPAELPVGVISSLLGAPFFVYFLFLGPRSL